MTPLNLDQLLRVAEEAETAAPGAWGIEAPMDCELSIAQADQPTHEFRFIAHCPLPDEDDHEAFTGGEIARLAKHIATFDPPTVKALIEQNRALVEAVTGLSDLIREVAPEYAESTVAANARALLSQEEDA